MPFARVASRSARSIPAPPQEFPGRCVCRLAPDTARFPQAFRPACKDARSAAARSLEEYLGNID